MNSRDELPEYFKSLGYKVGAEVGVFKGEFAKKFCDAGIKMYAIDPWIGFGGQGKHQRFQDVQDGYYEYTKNVLFLYPDCAIIRKTSMDALNDFKDGSLDFVYIDGDHNFRHVAEDIYEWVKKVRVGGVVSGHDYYDTSYTAQNMICNVKTVVDAYVKLFEIKNLQVLTGDSTPTWLWQK